MKLHNKMLDKEFFITSHACQRWQERFTNKYIEEYFEWSFPWGMQLDHQKYLKKDEAIFVISGTAVKTVLLTEYAMKNILGIRQARYFVTQETKKIETLKSKEVIENKCSIVGFQQLPLGVQEKYGRVLKQSPKNYMHEINALRAQLRAWERKYEKQKIHADRMDREKGFWKKVMREVLPPEILEKVYQKANELIKEGENETVVM